MSFLRRSSALVLLMVSSTALAADLLPLKHGIYVPQGVACKGASNADMVSYWGGKGALNVAQAECKITKLARKGNAFTVKDQCTDLQSGERIEGSSIVLMIPSTTKFEMDGTAYKYCGPKVQF
jgi:hypothetical protein